jgi:phage gpG-like protein
MLNSMRTRVKKRQILIGPTGRDNQEKAKFAASNRPFLDLDSKEEKKLVRDLEKELTRAIKKIFI